MLLQLHKRCIALVACVALLVATTGFLAHGYRTDGKHHDETRCEFCAQFTGSAGSPAITQLVAFVVVFSFLAPVPAAAFSGARRPPRAHRSRAPPQVDSI
jgi:hypothetical protein